MSKYIIKNCPNLIKSHYSTGETVTNQCELNEEKLCEDINDCLLKKIRKIAKGIAYGSDDALAKTGALQIGRLIQIEVKE